ncbi:MAG: prephenate dehydrogenase/arogenate dehydrogenase family protein [Spirochaetales bacterium]|nr:prephenate dehydrogenase/arogenate dehydrogenase family protein [Spirochaetales bacterium]
MRVGVYGLGRFGAFWARCLTGRYEVLAYSRNEQRETPEGVQRAEEGDVLACNAVFLCVAISAMEEVVSRIAPAVRDGATVFDTCSVKVHPIAVMDKFLPRGVHIIGTHPMFGPDSGKNGIEGLPLAYCPVRSSKENREFWLGEFRNMGLRVLSLDPEEHDREAAYTQGVTHFMGRVLNDMELKPSAIATKGYEKLLEIIEQTCNDPYQLFIDLQRYNPYTIQMRERLGLSLKKVQDQLLDTTSGEI